MKLLGQVRLAASLAIGCSWLSGCVGTVDSDQAVGEPTPDVAGHADAAPAREDVADQPSEQLAKIELSPTHQLEFLHLPETGVMLLKEEWDLDRDGINASVTAGDAVKGLTFDEIYVKLAGAGLERSVAARLRQVEGSLTNPPVLVGGEGSLGVQDVTATRPVTRPNGEIVASATQAICPEPIWDWPADEVGFRNQFCTATTQYCEALDASHTYNRQGRYSQSTHMNSSFCSGATYELQERFATACSIFSCTRRTFRVTSGSLNPRKGMNILASAGRDAADEWHRWITFVTSAFGNFTALAHHVYTQ